MSNKIVSIFKAKDLRSKILFVLGVFLVFRIMANIPVPGIDILRIKEFFARNEAFGLLNLFTGGALDRVSIVMLGLGPYITATIIFQLLTMIFPQFEKLYKEEGEQGRQKFNQYCRIASVPLAALQGFAMLMFLKNQGAIGDLSALITVTSVLSITCGSLILMWLGELISEKGIGNGVSLLIFAGIIADFPSNVQQMLLSFEGSQILHYIIFFIMALVIIAGVVMINEGRRNIPVSYAKRVRGNKLYGGASTYLPLNINPAGVIPIIFAIAILMLPGLIANFSILSGCLTFFKILLFTAYFILSWFLFLPSFTLLLLLTLKTLLLICRKWEDLFLELDQARIQLII